MLIPKSGPTSQQPSAYAAGLRRSFLAGTAALGLFGGTIGLWAAASPLSGAVVAPGQFVVDSNVKKIQHQTGGIVAVLPVKEGQRVKAGDLVLQLDETLTKANLQVIVKQLDEIMARQARLEAERGGLATMELPTALQARMDIPEVAKSVADEAKLLETRRSQRDGQRQQLGKRVEQLREEITGIDAQRVSRDQQIKLLAQELDGLRDLFKRNLVPMTRIMPVEREAANMLGQKGQLIAQKAQSEGKIAETQLQLLQLDIDMQTETGKELRELQSKTAELTERRVAAEDQLKRIDLRSPIDGYVHQLNVHTIGGVISPAEPAMLIVPFNDELQIEARVTPTDIDQLHLGQKAIVKVQAGNQRVTPELAGKISRIGADVIREQQTGMVYYLVRINVPPAELEKLGELRIMSGMMTESYIQTAERTPFQYMMKPLLDQFNRAFRER
jgi:HlyD family secretion protein